MDALVGLLGALIGAYLTAGMPRRTSEDPNSGHWLTFLMESRVVSNAWRSRCVKMWYPPLMATGSRRSSVSSLASFSERHSTANGRMRLKRRDASSNFT